MPWLNADRRSARPPAPAAGRGAHAAAVLAGLAALLINPAAAASAAGRWTAPATVTACPSATQPHAVFPSSDPRTASGAGAILWSGDCAAGAPAGSGIGLATVTADDAVGPAAALPQAISPATPLGQLASAAAVGDSAHPQLGILEGQSGSSFGAAVALRAAPVPLATSTSYLGDVALASVRVGTGRVVLRIQRHGSPTLTTPKLISGRAAPVTALAVGLDYRGDAIVAWAQRGWILRRVLRADGRLQTIERVAPSPTAPHLQALISDDNRGIVAWTTDVADTTSVYVDASLPGVHFSRPPRLLERFRDPPAVQLADGSMRLVRLANEGVMMAWTGLAGGHLVVRAASVSLAAPRPVSLVSDPATDAVLADLATGPHGEALALWTSAPRTAGGFDAGREQIVGARGVAQAPGLANFSAPEQIAGPGRLTTPRAAFDPTTDTAVAVWADAGRGIADATRNPADPSVPVHGSTGWRAWGLAGSGIVALVCVVVLCARTLRTRRARPPRGVLAAGSVPPDPAHLIDRADRRRPARYARTHLARRILPLRPPQATDPEGDWAAQAADPRET
jgi:hypothetical protein